MDHGNGSVGAVDGPEKRESDGVIASESDDAREGLSL